MATTMVRNNRGLTNEMILSKCPSVFADTKHESRSEKYQYVSTGQLLQVFQNEGFVPTMAMQAGSRKEGKKEFTKHLLRLRKFDELGDLKPDTHEIVLVNSHDGTSAYNLKSGVFRMVCTNGLITGDINQDYKVYHKGNITHDVIECAYRIIDEEAETMNKINQMKQIQLTQPEKLLLAECAMNIRFNDKNDEEEKPKEKIFEPSQFLRPRRSVDNENDLYTTFNVIQENMIKGGVSMRDRNFKKHTTREIKSIDGNVKLNQALWKLTNEMLKMKNS